MLCNLQLSSSQPTLEPFSFLHPYIPCKLLAYYNPLPLKPLACIKSLLWNHCHFLKPPLSFALFKTIPLLLYPPSIPDPLPPCALNWKVQKIEGMSSMNPAYRGKSTIEPIYNILTRFDEQETDMWKLFILRWLPPTIYVRFLYNISTPGCRHIKKSCLKLINFSYSYGFKVNKFSRPTLSGVCFGAYSL